MMTDSEKSTIFSAARQLLYCAGCIGVTFLEHAVAAVCKAKTFDENGFMENFQLGELLVACALFLFISFRSKTFHKTGFIFAALSATAAIRELDNV
ncbi:MAG: hypothetical protein IKS67_15280, partial [Victivallales bacterium]|nr:hypothetical protein [Victivallales bacterium]